MKLDRDLQRAILESLAEIYPRPMGLTAIHSRMPRNAEDQESAHLAANLAYLAQHRLIQPHKSQNLSDEESFSATHHGMDFLADDGGLSAILDVVTIKIHDDTLKSLVEANILRSDLPQPDKHRYLDALRELPAETTKHLALKLMDLGLANAPAALGVIGTVLGLGAGG